MDKPPSPVMVLNPQCMAAAALFEAASLRAERMARELPAGSPEAAVKLGLGAIYMDDPDFAEKFKAAIEGVDRE